MAGSSQNFEHKGYTYPKYLLEVEGEPIIQRVIESVEPLRAHLSFIIRKSDDDKFYLGSTLNILAPQSSILCVESTTKGAVCSALFAIDDINNGDELLIINGDQYIRRGIPEAVDKFREERLDGGIITFRSVQPRWSYVALDENCHVVETSEKRPISDMATAGCYYYKEGRNFVDAAFNIIRKNVCYKDNYYVCSTYNELILKQLLIGVYEIGKQDYISFATPQMYENYINQSKNYHD